MKKVLVLFSGGLDSLLSAKLLKEQGFLVEGVHFQNPFTTLQPKKVKEIATQIPLKLHFIKLGDDYLRLIESPKHGYGKRMNPCLDCRIFLLKKAWQLAQRLGTDSLATGEVIGQRPFSQTQEFLNLIEKEVGLANKICRPLIDIGIRGRSRKKQFELAKKYRFSKFLSPAGGCLLTDPKFAQKLKDVLENEGGLNLPMVELLKLGRHFRIGKKKVVVGRNEKENEKLQKLAEKEDWWYGEVVDVPSPTGVVFEEKVLKEASRLVTYYSDAQKGERVICHWRKGERQKKISLLVPRSITAKEGVLI